MDCLTAQSLISEAMDRQPVDAAALAEAKEHCRACAECAKFVRGQLVAKQAPLPRPPADLADRVMAAVRAEAKPAAADQAAEAPAPSEASAQPEDGDATPLAPAPALPPATLTARSPRVRRGLPRPLVVGGAAAAVVLALLGAGSVVVFGMRQMSPQKAETSSTYMITPGAGGAQSGAAVPNAAPTAPTDGSTAGGKQRLGATAAASGPAFITVGGTAYARTGPVTLDLTSKTGIGQTTSSLGTTGSPSSRTVYGGTDAGTVYAADDKGQTLAFARVTRSYLGQTYVLTAAELTAFGQWPALPSQVPAPTYTDGQPTFLYDGTDAAGVRVYRLSTSPVTSGIAIAPNGDAGGPVAGDPNWTWWTPLH